MFSVTRKRRNYTISLDSLHLRKAFRQKMQGDFLGVEMASEALISGRMETALTVNIILKTETWMIFLGISSEICSTVRADQPEEDGQASKKASFPTNGSAMILNASAANGSSSEECLTISFPSRSVPSIAGTSRGDGIYSMIASRSF